MVNSRVNSHNAYPIKSLDKTPSVTVRCEGKGMTWANKRPRGEGIVYLFREIVTMDNIDAPMIKPLANGRPRKVRLPVK